MVKFCLGALVFYCVSLFIYVIAERRKRYPLPPPRMAIIKQTDPQRYEMPRLVVNEKDIGTNGKGAEEIRIK